MSAQKKPCNHIERDVFDAVVASLTRYFGDSALADKVATLVLETAEEEGYVLCKTKPAGYVDGSDLTAIAQCREDNGWCVGGIEPFQRNSSYQPVFTAHVRPKLADTYKKDLEAIEALLGRSRKVIDEANR